MMIDVDLAKNVFQLHAASMTGHLEFRKKLTRTQFPKLMAEQLPSVAVMEACASASYRARQLAKLSREAKLIAPQYVRPFVKRQKNDGEEGPWPQWGRASPMSTAEAIVIAAQRPEMRFVPSKSEEQQACAALFGARERLVHLRTELVNVRLGLLYAFGHVVPQGIRQLKGIEAIFEDPATSLPDLVRSECRDLLLQISEKTARIEARLKAAKKRVETTDTARRLQTMPGVGPMTALAVEAFAPVSTPDKAEFRRGRDFAACLGLVPR